MTPSPTVYSTPSPTSPTLESQAPEAGADDTQVMFDAPVFDVLGFSPEEYGISAIIDSGTLVPLPTGILYASAALPQASGTGPMSYTVSGLPLGAGFDEASRLIFIDADQFIPANQESYPVACHTYLRVRMSVTVTYTASGPGGTTSITVPVQFGEYAASPGMLHFVC